LFDYKLEEFMRLELVFQLTPTNLDLSMKCCLNFPEGDRYISQMMAHTGLQTVEVEE